MFTLNSHFIFTFTFWVSCWSGWINIESFSFPSDQVAFTSNIRTQVFGRIRIIFGFKFVAKYECEYFYSNNIRILFDYRIIRSPLVKEGISDNLIHCGKVEKKGNPQVQPRKDIDVSWYKCLKVVWTQIGNDNKMYLWWVVYSVFNDSKQYTAPRFGLLLQAASHSRVISGGGESEWGWFKRWLDRWPGYTLGHWATRSFYWGGCSFLLHL